MKKKIKIKIRKQIDCGIVCVVGNALPPPITKPKKTNEEPKPTKQQINTQLRSTCRKRKIPILKNQLIIFPPSIFQ